MTWQRKKIVNDEDGEICPDCDKDIEDCLCGFPTIENNNEELLP